jgi:hypothetical protein
MPFCNEKLKIIAKGIQMVSINDHSTVYQLFEMYQSVCQNLDERLSTILIFCDISQAFDRACHEE